MSVLAEVSPARTGAWAPSRAASRLWTVAAALWAAGYAVVNATAALPANAQLWWQVRQGEQTLSTGQAMFAHSWSWTAGDLSWIPNSWGWGTLLAACYRLAGIAGVVVFVIAAQLVVLGLAWRVLGRAGLRPSPVRVGILVLLSLSMAGWANGQSELADYGVVFGFALICLSRRVCALAGWLRPAALGLAAMVLAAVWENLHLGGLLSIVVFTAVAALAPLGREHRRTSLALVAAGAALGVFATPAGGAGIAKSLATASTSRAESYAAWGPLFAHSSGYSYEPALLALALGLAAIALLLRRRRRRWGAAMILAVAALATCLVVRTASDLVMLSLLAAAPELARVSRRWRMPGLRARATAWAPRLTLAAFAAAGAWLIVALAVAAASVYPGWRLTGLDPADLAAIPQGARVFSTVSASDIIDAVRPDLQVTIDSRNDLYPVAQFEFDKSLTTSRVAQAPDYFEDNGVRAVFLLGTPAGEARTRLATTLRDAGWTTTAGVHGLVLSAPRSAPTG